MYDVIIIGAGAVGSATAYAAARAGVRVLLLEQYAIDHDRGSSHGASRIIRYAYDHALYVDLAREAFAAWAELEAAAGERFYLKTGGIDFAPPDEPLFEAMRSTLEATGIAHEVIGAGEAMRRFPQFTLNEAWHVLYQADAGALRASAAVRAIVRLARGLGVTVRDHTRVTGIEIHAASATVRCGDEVFEGARVVLAGGAWLNRLTEPLGVHIPLQPIAPQENYFTAADGTVSQAYTPAQFPVWIGHLQREYGQILYGLPDVDGSGVKIGLHSGPPIDPEIPSRVPDVGLVESLRLFAERHLPGASTHKASRVCLYTNTPDDHFVIDAHPQHPHVIIASCCSGHAFKFTPVLGSLIAERALNGGTQRDLTLFSLARFAGG